MKEIVKTTDLTKRYGDLCPVNHLDLSVKEGKIYGFLGPNGAGKSTTLKMLLGLVHPTAGEIDLFGQRFTEKNRRLILRDIGSLIESPSYYGHLTAKENLKIYTTILDLPDRNIDEVLKIVRLDRQGNKKTSQFSLGMKQRLGLASALLSFPKLLILDEPTTGLDPLMRITFLDIIREEHKKGKTVFMSSHSFEELAPLSINELNLIADGKTLSGIASDGAAASSKAYIGRDAAVDAALGHAGVTRSEVRKLDVDLDYEHGSMVYEVEFKVGTAEYEYDIGAADGDIIWYEIERDGTVEQGGSAIDGKAAISADDAKTAALNHAGLTASQVAHFKAELDREGGKLVYEIEFKSGGHEYEYVIDASTGAVIKSEKEHD